MRLIKAHFLLAGIFDRYNQSFGAFLNKYIDLFFIARQLFGCVNSIFKQICDYYSESGETCVVYKRKEGAYGLIIPEK